MSEMFLEYVLVAIIVLLPLSIMVVLFSKVMVKLESFFQQAAMVSNCPLYSLNPEVLENDKFLKFLHKL
ncbi:hypothetical protein AVCANL281_08915 [Campylobacter canadensis]|nr:hypothetical protein [Campylobacter canadensis]